jgi:hypothetical protein
MVKNAGTQKSMNIIKKPETAMASRPAVMMFGMLRILRV